MKIKFPKRFMSSIYCETCNNPIGLTLYKNKLIPIDSPPNYYKEYNKITGKREWLNGVDYSLKHKCDGSNYDRYYRDAVKNQRWQQ